MLLPRPFEVVVPEFVFSSQSSYTPRCELSMLSPQTTMCAAMSTKE